MNNTEEELNSLSYFLNKYLEIECTECHQKHKRSLIYELRLDLCPCEGQLRYRLYYYCTNRYMNDKYKYIGENTGLGFETIQEAVEDLKRYL